MAREIDEHVGARIRSRRREMGLTQGELGKLVGLAHQTIHKVETGALRVCAEHLWRLSNTLGVPVGHFFEGLDAPSGVSPVRHSVSRKQA